MDIDIGDLEMAAKGDGYVVSKHPSGYTVRLRGAVGQDANLGKAIAMAIAEDLAQSAMLAELDQEIT